MSVAPHCRARPSFSGLASTATIRSAPPATAAKSAFMPTPPRPTTATASPAWSPAVFSTAPAPVITAQPKIAASSSGMSRSIFTAARRDTTAYCAKSDRPLPWFTRSPFRRRMRLAPEARVPAARAAKPLGQMFGRPRTHQRQWPQEVTNTVTTWSPGARSDTPSPSSRTMPAPSCPITIGSGRGRMPSMAERSEWQRPAAAISISTSPGPGGSSSTSSTTSGRLSA